MIRHSHQTVFGDIPPDWNARPLRSLLSDQLSGDWGDDTGEVTLAVLRSTNFTDSGNLDTSDVARRGFSAAKAEQIQVRRTDILVERSGGGPNQPVGRVAMIRDDMPGTGFANFVQLLRPDSERIVSELLLWTLHQYNRSGLVERLQHQTTQMRNLDLRDYLKILLPVPSDPAEQARIAEALKAADDHIRALEDQIRKAKRVKKALTRDLFTSGIHTPKERLFVKTKLGSLPSDWIVAPLARICGGPDCVKTGPFGAQLPQEAFAQTGVRMLNITDIGDGEIAWKSNFYVTEETFQRLRDYELRSGDIAFSRVADVGRLACIRSEQEPLLMSSNCIRLRASPHFNSKFLTHAFKDAESVARQVVAMSNAGGRPIVTPRFLRQIVVPCPPSPEQNEIAARVEHSEQLITALHAELVAARRVKQSLLQNLLTGRTRLKP